MADTNPQQPQQPHTPEGDPDSQTPGAEGSIVPTRRAEAKEGGIPTFVSEIRSVPEQVGENVVNALHHDNSVGVLSFVQPGPGGTQRIVSVPLDNSAMSEIYRMLDEHAHEEEAEEVPCIGFQCLLQERRKREAEERKRAEGEGEGEGTQSNQ